MEVETKGVVESSCRRRWDETEGVGDTTGEDGTDKSAAYSTSPVFKDSIESLKFVKILRIYTNRKINFLN